MKILKIIKYHNMSNKEKFKAAVFLDRDGVLNQTMVQDGKPYAPRRVEDFYILDEAIEGTKLLKKAGFALIVVTNQPDVGNKLVERSIIEAMHEKLAQQLMLDAIKVCYHSQDEACLCRKPKPGMLLNAAQEFGITLGQSFMVGDRGGDILAGSAAGCRTIFIDKAYKEINKSRPDFTVTTFREAVKIILKFLPDKLNRG